MRKSQTEPAVLTAQREMFLQIQRKMEVMTMVPMTGGEYDDGSYDNSDGDSADDGSYDTGDYDDSGY